MKWNDICENTEYRVWQLADVQKMFASTLPSQMRLRAYWPHCQHELKIARWCHCFHINKPIENTTTLTQLSTYTRVRIFLPKNESQEKLVPLALVVHCCHYLVRHLFSAYQVADTWVSTWFLCPLSLRNNFEDRNSPHFADEGNLSFEK